MNPFQQPSLKLKKLYTGIFILSLLGVLVTAVLIYIHFEGSSAGSFCSIDDYWNCDRVNKSTFAEIFDIPVSIYGLLFYCFLSIFSFALLRGFNFQKALSFIKLKWLPLISLLGCSLLTLGLLFYELTILGNLAAWGVIKNLVFLIFYYLIFSFCRKNPYPNVELLGFLGIMILFGVNFSLYLTNIELLVLEAICIFCFSQQFIILIISGLTILALKQSKKDHNILDSNLEKLSK